MARRRRPELKLEMGPLGTVDPFTLKLEEAPPGSGRAVLTDPSRNDAAIPLEAAELSLVGASQALFHLSLRWLRRAGADVAPCDSARMSAEVRLLLERREARLLEALLRRHLARLPEPPAWMPELLRSLAEIDEFLRWEEA